MMRETEDIMDSVRRLDPIDADRLAGSWSRSADKQMVLETIMAAPEPAAAPAPHPAHRDGHALQAELREYGVDSEVVTIVASPSMVGLVSVFTPEGENGLPGAPGLSVGGEDGTPEVFQLTIDPDVFQGKLTIEVAVAAGDGEPYVLRAAVFDPGEVLAGLHCALGEPVSAADVAFWLDRLGLDARWQVLSPPADPPGTDSTQVTSVPAGDVVSGHALDASTVEFEVVPPDVDLPHERAQPLSDVACTPEQAAPWK